MNELVDMISYVLTKKNKLVIMKSILKMVKYYLLDDCHFKLFNKIFCHIVENYVSSDQAPFQAIWSSGLNKQEN